MKKRLLSAVLALVMVLALLPMGAFAYDAILTANPDEISYTSGSTTKQYAGVGSNGSYNTIRVERATATNYTDGRVYGHWYWLANYGNGTSTEKRYYEIKSGIVSGVSNSGNWYPDVRTYSRNDKVTGAFTVVGTGTNLDLSSYENNSLQVDIDVESQNLTVPATITNLTITSKWLAEQGKKGTLSGITINRSDYNSGVKSGLTLTASNVIIGAIDLQGRSNTLTLTDCDVSGISMSGTTNTSQAGNPTYTAQRLTASGRTKITGSIVLSGDGSTVSLTNTIGDATISVKGNNGSVTVAGASKVGAIGTEPRTSSGQWPSVTVTGGTTGVITQDVFTGNSNTATIKVDSTTGITTVGGIVAEKANVTIASADVSGAVTVKAGKLDITGSGVDVTNAVTLGEKDTTTLNISAKGSTFGSIAAYTDKGANVVIGQWVGDRKSDGGNDYGKLDLGAYSGKKVTGGTFAQSTDFGNPACMKWLDTDNIQFYVRRSGKYDLYKNTELARAISDIGTTGATGAQASNNITVLGQGGSSGNAKVELTLMNGNIEWAKIGYNDTTGIILPTQVNNVTISEWIGANNASVPAGTKYPVPYAVGGVTLNATATASTVQKITKAVASNSNPEVQNQNVGVALNGNVITLTGAVAPTTGGYASIYIDLETDVVQKDGKALVLKGIVVNYDPLTRTVAFNVWQPGLSNSGAIVQNGALVLNNGTGERYTLSANLSVSASDLGISNSKTGEVQVTFGGNLARWTDVQKQAIINEIKSPNGFGFENDQAMQIAINAAQATITNNSSVASWVTNAKNTIWRSGLKGSNGQYVTDYCVPHTGNFDAGTTDGGQIASAFGKAYLVPYLVVNITEYDEAAGTMTATLTPYYRVDVSSDSGTYVPALAYTVQQGRPLSLSSGLSANSKINLTNVKFNNQQMHQDGKYVYQATGTVWTVTHVGANGTLGNVVINGSEGSIKMTSTIAGRVLPGCTYDNLQAAIDDTVPGVTAVNSGDIYNVGADTAVNGGAYGETMDIITIGGTYTGSCDITMTGLARKVLIIANGQQNVKSTNSAVSVQNAGGFRYIAQLTRDVGVTGGSVVISVNNPTTNVGTISVSASRANAGQTVTVTVSPANGYGISGISAVTNTGASVSISSTGTANQYSFVVPTGATSVTVTPNFGVAGRAQINVQSSVGGTATVSSTNVAGGSQVTVYTVPSNGYRATSVTVNTNVGSVSAINTGTNTWTFTVPTNATTVTVTPNFGVNTGVPFTDVKDTDYYLNAVKFVYSHNMMQGDGSTTFFNGTGNITRGQIVTILYRLEGEPAASTSTSFTDVSPTQYYAKAVAWASANGIVNGRTTTRFAPNDNITRQELAAILYRYNTQYKKLTTGTMNNLSSFTDRNKVDADYAVTPMQWAVGNGIITGTTPTTLSPNGTATRYQAATMLMRYCQSFLKMS